MTIYQKIPIHADNCSYVIVAQSIQNKLPITGWLHSTKDGGLSHQSLMSWRAIWLQKSKKNLEKEKFKKKQKEEFDTTVFKIQQRITVLKLERDDLEHYSRHVCVRIEDFSVVSEEPADSVYEKVGDSKVVCPSVLYWKGPWYRVGI